MGGQGWIGAEYACILHETHQDGEPDASATVNTKSHVQAKNNGGLVSDSMDAPGENSGVL